MWYTTCRWVQDLDQPEVDYIVNVLAVAGEDFDFGMDGKGAFEALGKLLVTADCVSDYSECHAVCSKLCDKYGKHGLVKAKPTVRSLLTPMKIKLEILANGAAITE